MLRRAGLKWTVIGEHRPTLSIKERLANPSRPTSVMAIAVQAGQNCGLPLATARRDLHPRRGADIAVPVALEDRRHI